MDEKKAQQLLHRMRQEPRERRLLRTWFGKLFLNAASVVAGESLTQLGDGEQPKLSTSVERITLLLGITPGRLLLTTGRLKFVPVLQPWFWPSLRVELPTEANLLAEKGRFLSRGVHMSMPWMRFGRFPGLFHTANLKVRAGRKACWFRVEDPTRWEEAVNRVSTSV
jgi:hypothetical protein